MTMISGLVRCANAKKVFDAFPKQIMPEDRQQLYDVLDAQLLQARGRGAKVLDAERVMMDLSFNNPELLLEGLGFSGGAVERAVLKEEIVQAHAFYLDNMVQTRKAFMLPYVEGQLELSQLPNYSEQFKGNNLIGSMLQSDTQKIYIKFQIYEARLKMNMISLKIAAYKQLHGEQPQSLEQLQLSPSLIRDNFSGKSFSLEKVNGITRLKSAFEGSLKLEIEL